MTRLALPPLQPLGLQPLRAARQQQRPLSTDEEQSILSRLGRTTVSGIGAVGNLLDLPGSSVRDFLAGENPLDQWLSPFSAENRVTGRDLLRRGGAVGQEDTWGNFGGGLAAEIALDPLTYLTFGLGAVTKAGAVARKAGLLDRATDVGRSLGAAGPRTGRMAATLEDLITSPPISRDAATGAAQYARGAGSDIAARRAAEKAAGGSLDELLGQPLGGAFGVGLPFQAPMATFGGSQVPRGLDWLGGKIARSPVGVGVKALFHAPAKGQWSAGAQSLAESMTGFERKAGAQASQQALDMGDRVGQGWKAFDEAFGEGVRDRMQTTRLQQAAARLGTTVDELPAEVAAELAVTSDDVFDIYQRAVRLTMESKGDVGPAAARFGIQGDLSSVRNVADEMVKANRAVAQQIQDMGADLKLLDQFNEMVAEAAATHAPRYVDFKKLPAEARRRIAPHMAGVNIARTPETRRINTETVNQLLTDPKARGADSLTHIKSEYAENLDPSWARDTKAFKVAMKKEDAELMAGRDEGFSQIIKAARKEGGLDEYIRKNGVQRIEEPGVNVNFDKPQGLYTTPAHVESLHLDLGGSRTDFVVKPGFREVTVDISGFADDVMSRGVDQMATNLVWLRTAMPKVAASIRGKSMAQLREMFGAKFPEVNWSRYKEIQDMIEGYAGMLARTNGIDVIRGVELRPTALLPPGTSEEVVILNRDALVSAGELRAHEAAMDARAAQHSKDLHADALQKWVKKHAKRPLFTRKTVDDFAQYQSSAQRLAASMSAIHEHFGRNLSEGGVPIYQAFQDAGLNADTALEHFARRHGMSIEQAASATIPEETAKGAKAMLAAQPGTEYGNRIGQAMDRWMQHWKQAVYLPFPASVERNLHAGLFMNVASGEIPIQEIPNFTKALYHVQRMATGKVDDVELLRAMYTNNILDPRFGFEGVERSTLRKAPGDLEIAIVPESPTRLRQTWRQAQESIADDGVRNPLGSRAAYRTLLGTGSKANHWVEWLVRGSMFKHLRDKGWDDAAAAAKVRELHFDYSRAGATPFERGVMKRAVPFYTFARGIAEYTMRELMRRPGGAFGRSITTSGRAGDPGVLAPEHIAQGAAIPMGEGPEGSQTFISGLGLPFEDSLQFLSAGAGPGAALQHGLSEIASRTNPLIKAPIELATGRSLFQGRALEDLDPTYARLISNVRDLATGERTRSVRPLAGSQTLEAILGNLPTSRFGTTARTLTDPRKWEDPTSMLTNLFTGVRRTHVSPEQMEHRAQQLAEQRMQRELGAREFTRRWIPEDLQERFTPDQRILAEQMNALLATLARRQRERSK